MLFAEFVSNSLPVIVAVFDIEVVRLLGTVTMIVIDAVPAAARVPMFPVTVPEASTTVPEFEVADTNVTPAGNTSVTTTPVAGNGPLLVIASV